MPAPTDTRPAAPAAEDSTTVPERAEAFPRDLDLASVVSPPDTVALELHALAESLRRKKEFRNLRLQGPAADLFREGATEDESAWFGRLARSGVDLAGKTPEEILSGAKRTVLEILHLDPILQGEVSETALGETRPGRAAERFSREPSAYRDILYRAVIQEALRAAPLDDREPEAEAVRRASALATVRYLFERAGLADLAKTITEVEATALINADVTYRIQWPSFAAAQGPGPVKRAELPRVPLPGRGDMLAQALEKAVRAAPFEVHALSQEMLRRTREYYTVIARAGRLGVLHPDYARSVLAAADPAATRTPFPLYPFIAEAESRDAVLSRALRLRPPSEEDPGYGERSRAANTAGLVALGAKWEDTADLEPEAVYVVLKAWRDGTEVPATLAPVVDRLRRAGLRYERTPLGPAPPGVTPMGGVYVAVHTPLGDLDPREAFQRFLDESYRALEEYTALYRAERLGFAEEGATKKALAEPSAPPEGLWSRYVKEETRPPTARAAILRALPAELRALDPAGLATVSDADLLAAMAVATSPYSTPDRHLQRVIDRLEATGQPFQDLRAEVQRLLRLPENLGRLLDGVADAARAAASTDREEARRGEILSRQAGRVVEDLLSPLAVLFLSAEDYVLRPAARWILDRVLSRRDQLEAALRMRTGTLRLLGLKDEATLLEEGRRLGLGTKDLSALVAQDSLDEAIEHRYGIWRYLEEGGASPLIGIPTATLLRVASPFLLGIPTAGAALLVPSAELHETVARYGVLSGAPLGGRAMHYTLRRIGSAIEPVRRHMLYSAQDPLAIEALLDLLRKAGGAEKVPGLLDRLRPFAETREWARAFAREDAFIRRSGGDLERAVRYGLAVNPAETVAYLDPTGYLAAQTPNILRVLSLAEYDEVVQAPILREVEGTWKGEETPLGREIDRGLGLAEVRLLLDSRAESVRRVRDRLRALTEAALADNAVEIAAEEAKYATLKALEAEYAAGVAGAAPARRVTATGLARFALEREPTLAKSVEDLVGTIRRQRSDIARLQAKRAGLESVLAGLMESEKPRESVFAPEGITAPRVLIEYLRKHPEIVEQFAAHDPWVEAGINAAASRETKKGTRKLSRAAAIDRFTRTSLGLEGVAGTPLERYLRALRDAETIAKLRTPIVSGGRQGIVDLMGNLRRGLEADRRRVKNLLVSFLRALPRGKRGETVFEAVNTAFAEPGLNPGRAAERAVRELERLSGTTAGAREEIAMRDFVARMISNDLQLLHSLPPGMLSAENIQELVRVYVPHLYEHRPPGPPPQFAPTPATAKGFVSAPIQEVTRQRGLEGSAKPWRVIYRRAPDAPRYSRYFATEKEAREFAKVVATHGGGEATVVEPISLADQVVWGLSKDQVKARFESHLGLVELYHQSRFQDSLVRSGYAIDAAMAKLRDPALVEHVHIPDTEEWGALRGMYLHKETLISLKSASDYSTGLQSMFRGFIDALHSSGLQTQLDALGITAEVAKGWRGSLRALTQIFRSVAMTSWILLSPRTWISQFVFNTFLAHVGFRLTPFDLLSPAFRRGALRLLRPEDPVLAELIENGVALDMPYPVGRRPGEGSRARNAVADIVRDLFDSERSRTAARKAAAIEATIKRLADLPAGIPEEKLPEIASKLEAARDGYRRLAREWAGTMLERVERRARDLAEDFFLPYTAVDAIFKVGTAEVLRERGMPAKEIAWRIRQFYQAYSDVPPTIRALSRSPAGAMIPTFPYEFLRIGLNLVRYRWPELSMALMAIQAANNVGLALDHMTWDDHVALHSRGNDQLGAVRAAFAIHVPGGYDVDLGALLGLDVFTMGHGLTGYLGYELQKRNGYAPAIAAAIANTASNFVLNQPMVNSVFSFALNRDSFTRRPIIDDSSTQMDKFLYLLKQYLPSWVPWTNYDTYWSRRLYGDVFERETGEPRPPVTRALAFLGIDDSSRKAAVARVVRNAQRLAGGAEGWRAALVRHDGEVERAAMGILMAQPGDKVKLLRDYLRLGREAHPRATPGQIFRLLERRLRTGPTAFVFADLSFRAQTYALRDLARRGMSRYPEWSEMVRAYLGGDDALSPTRETAILSVLAGGKLPTAPDVRSLFDRLSRVSDADLLEAIDILGTAPERDALRPLVGVLNAEYQRRRLRRP